MNTVPDKDINELGRIRDLWTTLAEQDPLWAILTDRDKYNRGWQMLDFFDRGRVDARILMGNLRELGITPVFGDALDFGCGVGRMTTALADYFARCTGVDVAAPMIEQARALTPHPQRCRYVLNQSPDLAQFAGASFDFVHSVITLQHVSGELALGYVQEFMRLLRRGGIAVFQLPTGGRWPAAAPHPADGLAADIRCADTILYGHAGSSRVISCRIDNVGTAPWLTRSASAGQCDINLGNHWRAADGSLLVADDGREAITRQLQPGQALHLGLMVRLPATPGQYVLELDMVQEGVRWFADTGSRTTRVPVVVLAAPPVNPEPDRGDALLHMIEMFGAARTSVARTVDLAGGELLSVYDSNAAGGGLEDHWYVVRKR